jgi:hypothetical protein
VRGFAILAPAVAALVACAQPALAPPPAAAAPAKPAAIARSPVALRNPSFEADMGAERRCAPAWDCTTHNDPLAFRFFLQENAAAGGRSLCVERVANEPWALVTQAFDNPALRGARVRLSMAVLVEAASGEGAGPWALVPGNPPLNPRRLVRGTAGWQRLAVDFTVPANAAMVEVGATLEGPGKACFDDVRLEVVAG